MARIYSAFIQSGQNDLQLDREFIDALRFFGKPKIQAKVNFTPQYSISVSDLTKDLLGYQNDLALFHFSGHSDQEGLIFKDEEFDEAYITDFFNAINRGDTRLDCVVLNGCSNAKLVNRLSSVPVVIGTKSDILDRDAITFVNNFFNALIEGEATYEAAFESIGFWGRVTNFVL